MVICPHALVSTSSWQNHMAEETLHLMANRKQRMKWGPGATFKVS